LDTLRLSTDVAKDLIRLGAISGRNLANLRLEDRAVPRSWVDRLAREAGETLDITRRRVVELTESVPEGQVRLFLESIDALAQAFQTPSLQGPRLTPAAVSLLLHRVIGFLRSGFRELADIARTLGHEDLHEQCRYLAKAIASPAKRVTPYSAPIFYQKYLQIFEEADAKPDPLASLLVIRPASSLQSRLPRAPLSGERGRREPYVSDVALEISTPVAAIEPLDDAEKHDDRTYRVWFGSNRTPLQPTDPAGGFSATIDTKLHLGSCLVFVPRSHEEGSLGSSWFRRTFVLRADDRLRLDSIRVFDRDKFQERISAELDCRPQHRSALIFVHGFNVTFEAAALRAAQLACDLNVDGVTAFYSWPSVGSVRDYAHDEETIRVTVPRFLEFLDALLEINGLQRADIIAHSMGNRLVAAAMEKLASSPKRNRIGHLVLAAADVARVEFIPLAHHYAAVATKAVTLYSCARDRALGISSAIHNYERIGFEPPIFLCDGIDTISATRVKLDLLGHGYIATAKPLIADLKKLLWAGLKPAQRGLIALPDAAAPEYWLLKAK
jgi:esterase/lipase superfamily enzyme